MLARSHAFRPPVIWFQVIAPGVALENNLSAPFTWQSLTLQGAQCDRVAM